MTVRPARRVAGALLLAGGVVVGAAVIPGRPAPGQAARPPGRGDPARGARIFERCAGCHGLEPDAGDRPGPALHRLLGRPAAGWPGYDYSPALREAGTGGRLVWTEATLDAFLADPGGYVPGTWMGAVGVRAPEDRADLIAFLRAATR